jgi:hypothetical protein
MLLRAAGSQPEPIKYRTRQRSDVGREPAVGARFRFSWAFVWTVLAAAALAPSTLAAEPEASASESVSAATATQMSRAAPTLTPVVSPPARGARRIPHVSTTNAPAASPPPSTSSPQATASPLAVEGGEASSLLSNFNGVSSLDSAVTNFGQEFEPPDQGLCVGNGFVLEMVNSAYTVYRSDGSVVTGPFNVNGPFNEGLTEFTSDPRCYFDAATHTWFATILSINRESTASSLDIAVNTSGDPTTLWTDYKIDTTGIGGKTGPKHTECPCFGDQPTLGIDSHNLYVTTNEFSILGPQFNGAQLYAIAKKDLVALSPKPHFVRFANLKIAGSPAASVQPALTTGASPAEYFLSSIDPSETSGQQIGVWALSNAAAVASGGKPTLSKLILPSEPFAIPPAAEQKGASSLLEPDDDRMQQVQFINGSLWGELSTAVSIVNDPLQRSGAAWFQVHPTLRSGAISAAPITRQGYLAVRDNYLLYPALQVTPGGSAVMVDTLSGKTHFPSAAYSVLGPAASAFGPVTVAAAGSDNYDPEAERWGDYSWAVLDPSGASVWLATEYVPPKSSQTTDGSRDWGTRVLQVGVGG